MTRHCDSCRWFHLEPYKKRGGVCFASYHEGRYKSASKDMCACEDWAAFDASAYPDEVCFVTNCDRDALLNLADEMEAQAWQYETKNWDIPTHFLKGYADEIRRFCGGEDE